MTVVYLLDLELCAIVILDGAVEGILGCLSALTMPAYAFRCE